jgi:hypothetical protein
MLIALAENQRRPKPRPLCSVCAEVLSVSGAGVVVMREGRPAVTVCASDSTAAVVEDLQFQLGEGPCVDAFALNRPVLEGDLAGLGRTRWPGFTGPAVAAGARAVFGFPLRADHQAIGAMNLYQSRPGELAPAQLDDALGVADVIAAAVLDWQAKAGPDRVPEQLGAGLESRAVVHQATGMISVQLDGTLDAAFARLQASAFGENRSIAEVAEEVVERRRRFE